MTIPRAVKLKLIAAASLSLYPDVCALLCLSEPARSTRLSSAVLMTSFPPILAAYSITTRKTLCERLDTSFILVAATDLCF